MYEILKIEKKWWLCKTTTKRHFVMTESVCEVVNDTDRYFSIDDCHNSMVNTFVKFKKQIRIKPHPDTDTSVFFNESEFIVKSIDIPNLTQDCEYHLNKDTVKKIKSAVPFVSTERNRYFMCGFFFAENGDIVATNGRTMAVIKTQEQYNNDIVPPSVFHNFKNDVTVSRLINSEKQVYFKLSDGNKISVVSCIEGIYPNYKKVIPDHYSYEADVSNLNVFKNIKTNHVYIDNNIVKIDKCAIGEVSNFPSERFKFQSEHLTSLQKIMDDSCLLRYQEGRNIFTFTKDNITVLLVKDD